MIICLATQVSQPLLSYYQYYPPIAEAEQEIRSLLTEPLAVRREAHRQRGSHTNIAFLHIRRGDYLKNPSLTPVLPMSYYVTAVNRLLNANPAITKILVLSDDIKWVATQPLFQSQLFELTDYDELDSMALMSICKGGAILANSTFSWWGAFLGPYEDRSPIFYPQSWIPGEIVNLFPKEWTPLPST